MRHRLVDSIKQRFRRFVNLLRSVYNRPDDFGQTVAAPSFYKEDSKIFAYEYRENKQVGHVNPAPEVGAPTMVWHVGVWPERMWDPSNATITPEDMEEAVDPSTPSNIYETILEEFRENREALFAPAGAYVSYRKRKLEYGEEKTVIDTVNHDSLNDFLIKLQKLGRCSKNNDQDEQFHLVRHNILLYLAHDDAETKNIYDIIKQSSIRFTLWWQEGEQTKFTREKPPSTDAIRVAVHAQIFPDYYMVSFYIDPTKPWNQAPITTTNVEGRRKRILDAANDICTICDGRLKPGQPREPLIPEGGEITPAVAERLLKARNYLYSDIWAEFRKSFQFELEDIVTPRGHCFVNIRGLVLPTCGVVSNVEPDSATKLRPIARFYENANAGLTEADTVVRAYWPFIRRITHHADVKDHIACGLMDWRALYITALGSQEKPRPYEEWDDDTRPDIPSKYLPEDHDLKDIRGRGDLDEVKRQEEEEKKQPIRYLLLTKGEPERKQIGRIVHRLNMLGTFRLFALKDWSILRDADTQIRLRGQELDAVMTWWSAACKKINEEYRAAAQKISPTRYYGRYGGRNRKREENSRKIEELLEKESDLRDHKLTDVNQKAEAYLINISASLDNIGKNIIGGLHYRVNRSTYFINLFLTLVRLTKFGAIDSWTSYDQFVDRGLQPEFEFIQQIGRRLSGLRDRLQGVTQSIQTSAMVVQASATRKNTETLRKIARYYAYSAAGIFAAIITWLSSHFNFFQDLWNFFHGIWAAILRLFGLA